MKVKFGREQFYLLFATCLYRRIQMFSFLRTVSCIFRRKQENWIKSTLRAYRGDRRWWTQKPPSTRSISAPEISLDFMQYGKQVDGRGTRPSIADTKKKKKLRVSHRTWIIYTRWNTLFEGCGDLLITNNKF